MRTPDESRDEAPEAGDPRTVAEVLRPLLPTPAPRGPVLFVASHLDGVLLGASWLLRRSPGGHVIHVTTHDTPVRSREREAIAALGLAGLPREQIFSLGAAEHQAALQLTALTEYMVALLKALRPALLVTPPYEGSHPDDDATAFITQAAVDLVARAGRTPPLVVEMTSSHLDRLPGGPFLPTPDGRPESRVRLAGAERAAKQRLLARGLGDGPVEWERYRLAPRYDFTRPPHEGPLRYEAADLGMTGRRWRHLARESLRELKLPETPWH